MKLIIGYLYGDLMNMYGDIGNIIALTKRAQWRGIEVEVRIKNLESRIKEKEIDLYFFGGGQDQQQDLVAKDLGLSSKGQIIKQEVERGVPLLAICGGYQLLGEYYQPFEGEKLPGVGLFPTYTKASPDRMIGNLVISSSFIVHSKKTNKQSLRPDGLNHEPITNNYLVGFENHSGKTYLKEGGIPLGTVTAGFGNNGEDKTEGCLYKNAIGCYMHGSLLPKNPKLADWLIKKALETKYQKLIELEALNDELEENAHQAAIDKFNH
jgi:lipid II isoglutaminyl synthase (glutamine-hydrolysing)